MAPASRPAPLVKSPLSSLRPSPSSWLHAADAEPVELVDRAQHGETLAGIGLAAEADGFEHAVEHLAVVHLDHVLPRGMPSASMVSAAIMQISASAAGDALPTVSASNCMNWRKRPGPGFSLRNTQPKR